MAKIHLDPWTDIVGVGWGSITHVAFGLNLDIAGGLGTWETYNGFEDPCSPNDPSGGAGFPYQAFFRQTYQRAEAVINSGAFYKRKKVGSTYTWQASSSSEIALAGYNMVPGASPGRRRFEKTWADWVTPGINEVAPTGRAIGFTPKRGGSSGIPVPTDSAEFFDSSDNGGVQYYLPSVSTRYCFVDAFDPDGIGYYQWGVDYLTTSLESMTGDLIGGTAITFRGRPCTIVGAWTPPRERIIRGGAPAELGATVDLPIDIAFIAHVDGAAT
jgi:hypothetical protein